MMSQLQYKEHNQTYSTFPFMHLQSCVIPPISTALKIHR